MTRTGLEQATPEVVANERAKSIRRALERDGGRRSATVQVLDATCGIGSEVLSLGREGVEAVAADLDPLHARIARTNLQCAGRVARVLVADAARPAARADFLIVDPDRRASGRRSLAPHRWSPTLADALSAGRGFGGACLKLPPAIDPARIDLAPAGPREHRWQWVSLGGELREVALWLGPPGSAGPQEEREALVLRNDGTPWRLTGVPRPIVARTPEEARRTAWIAEADPAVLRSGLLGVLAAQTGMAPLAPQIAYLGSTERPPASPFLRLYRVLGVSKVDRRRVREMLAPHGVGALTVKKRGHPETADVLARKLRGRGSLPGTLIVTRLEDGHAAYLVEPDPR